MEALVPTKGRGPLPCVDLREATERYGSSLPASQSSGTRGSVMWQHLLEQIYERIRPASLNSTGLL